MRMQDVAQAERVPLRLGVAPRPPGELRLAFGRDGQRAQPDVADGGVPKGIRGRQCRVYPSCASRNPPPWISWVRKGTTSSGYHRRVAAVLVLRIQLERESSVTHVPGFVNAAIGPLTTLYQVREATQTARNAVALSLLAAAYGDDPRSSAPGGYDDRAGRGNPNQVTRDDIIAINTTMRAPPWQNLCRASHWNPAPRNEPTLPARRASQRLQDRRSQAGPCLASPETNQRLTRGEPQSRVGTPELP
jgi:hypothetical protein